MSTQQKSGQMLVASGLIGAAVGVLTLAYPAAVDDKTWSYPFPFGVALVVSVVLAGTHLLSAAGFQGVRRADAHAGSRSADIALRAVIGGFALLVVAEVASGTIGHRSDNSSAADTVGALYGVASLLVGFGAIIAGVAIVRAGVWSGVARWSLLISGLVILAVVTPAQAADSLVVVTAGLIAWSLSFVPIGLAVMGQLAAARPKGVPSESRQTAH